MNNIPKVYKLVPVELIERAIAATMTARGRGCPTERDLRAAIAAPTPPQPIYDEAKEREMFAEFSRRIVAHDAANFPIRWCDCVPDDEIEDHLNTWLACAQSRAKAGEVGHE